MDIKNIKYFAFIYIPSCYSPKNKIHDNKDKLQQKYNNRI